MAISLKTGLCISAQFHLEQDEVVNIFYDIIRFMEQSFNPGDSLDKLKEQQATNENPSNSIIIKFIISSFFSLFSIILSVSTISADHNEGDGGLYFVLFFPEAFFAIVNLIILSSAKSDINSMPKYDITKSTNFKYILYALYAITAISVILAILAPALRFS